MRLFSPGETFPPARFGISGATGAAVNADSTPTLAVFRNGVLDGAVSVTVANPATGEYSFTFTIPGGYALGDVVSVRAAATVGGIVLAPQELVSFRLDSKIATRSVAGDAMALTGGERTTLYTGIWANASRSLTTFGSLATDAATAVWANSTRTLSTFGTLVADIATAVWAAATRTLTAISDSSGVTTLLSRIGASLTITSGKVDVNDKSGFSLATAPPTLANIRADIERAGGPLILTQADAASAKTRVELGVPAAAPGASTGVARVTDISSGSLTVGQAADLKGIAGAMGIHGGEQVTTGDVVVETMEQADGTHIVRTFATDGDTTTLTTTITA